MNKILLQGIKTLLFLGALLFTECGLMAGGETSEIGNANATIPIGPQRDAAASDTSKEGL